MIIFLFFLFNFIYSKVQQLQQLLSEQKRFYQNLHKTNDSVKDSDSIEALLNSLNIIPKLWEEQRQSCEGRITTEECRTIIETFQNNESPGNDGLPIEFYKSCWDLISEPFIDCVNESFDKEEMSNSQRRLGRFSISRI